MYDIAVYGIACLVLLLLGYKVDKVMGALGSIMFFAFPFIFGEQLELGTMETAMIALAGIVMMFVYVDRRH